MQKQKARRQEEAACRAEPAATKYAQSKSNQPRKQSTTFGATLSQQVLCYAEMKKAAYNSSKLSRALHQLIQAGWSVLESCAKRRFAILVQRRPVMQRQKKKAACQAQATSSKLCKKVHHPSQAN